MVTEEECDSNVENCVDKPTAGFGVRLDLVTTELLELVK